MIEVKLYNIMGEAVFLKQRETLQICFQSE